MPRARRCPELLQAFNQVAPTARSFGMTLGPHLPLAPGAGAGGDA